MPSGGKREGAGRHSLPVGEKRSPKTYKLPLGTIEAIERLRQVQDGKRESQGDVIVRAVETLKRMGRDEGISEL